MKKKYLHVLNRITASIPQELLDNLIEVKPMTPTMKKVYKMALKDPKVNPKLKEQMQVMLDSKMLDRKQEIVNRDVEQQIEEYLDKEIKKAIENGELPPITKDRAIHKKLRQYYANKSRKN